MYIYWVSLKNRKRTTVHDRQPILNPKVRICSPCKNVRNQIHNHIQIIKFHARVPKGTNHLKLKQKHDTSHDPPTPTHTQQTLENTVSTTYNN